MSEIITAVSTAIELSKKLVGLAGVTKDAEARLIIADLQIQLAEVKMKLAELLEENTALKTSLNNAASISKEVVYKDGLYFDMDGDGPFCTACYDSANQLVRVSQLEKSFHAIAKWRCNVCKGTYM